LDSDWYVFWESTKAEADAAAAGQPKPKSEERLAIWRAHNKETPSFTYADVREMLTSGNFSRIPGFDESSRKVLHACMTEFVDDVDSAAPNGGPGTQFASSEVAKGPPSVRSALGLQP
jgi:hypothetical protein